MYKSYEFTFADTPASIYGMFVCDIGNKSHSDNEFGNKANIVEKRIANRITPLHYGVRYHDTPLTFTLIFGSEEYMDRYQIQEVSNWLTGYQDYQWLSIDQPDMEHIQFRCLIQSLTPISIRWLPIAFEAKVICDCPYGYSYPFEERIPVNGTINHRFYNDSTIKENLRPEVQIILASGCKNFSITNLTTGTFMEFSALPNGGITIIVDNENEIVRDSYGQYDLYEHFNFQFLEFASGDNQLVITGSGTVVINGRYLYNVGA
ncbi:phage tail domain-containing protein [Oscillospiraceae bacterium 50-58]|nr:hypothetical protein [Oscillospiraceae bacterium]